MSEFLYASAKIANLCVQAFQEQPEKVTIEFPKDGAFRDTCPTDDANLGFLNGLLGRAPDSADALETVRAHGMDVVFQFGDFPCHPDGRATVQVTLEKGTKKYFFLAVCTGAQDCLVYIFDRVPVSFRGNCYEFLIFIETWAADKKEGLSAELREKVQPIGDTQFTTNGTCWLLTIPCQGAIPQSLLDQLNALDYVQLALQLQPVALETR